MWELTSIAADHTETEPRRHGLILFDSYLVRHGSLPRAAAAAAAACAAAAAAAAAAAVTTRTAACVVAQTDGLAVNGCLLLCSFDAKTKTTLDLSDAVDFFTN